MNDEVTQEQQAEAAHAEAVEQATRMGWDASKYEENDPRYKTAEEFVAFGEKIQPIMRANLRRLEDEVKKRDAELAAIREEVRKFGELHEQTRKQAYAQALADLKAQKKEALDAMDGAAVVEIDEKIAAIKEAEKTEQKPAVREANANVPDVEAQRAYGAWLADNEWANKQSPKYDKELEAYAIAVGLQLINDGMPHTGADFEPHLQRITNRVKETFAHKFENQRRNAPPAAESASGGHTVTPRGKHTYAQLPPEAKEVCDFYVKTNQMTREDYLANYRWE